MVLSRFSLSTDLKIEMPCGGSVLKYDFCTLLPGPQKVDSWNPDIGAQQIVVFQTNGEVAEIVKL